MTFQTPDFNPEQISSNQTFATGLMGILGQIKEAEAQKKGGIGSMFGGALGGAATGAKIGSIVPGLGTGIGAGIGGIMGGLGGMK